MREILLLFLVCFFAFPVPSVAASKNEETAALLESAAKLCEGECRETCLANAEAIRVQGIDSGRLRVLIKSCESAFNADVSGDPLEKIKLIPQLAFASYNIKETVSGKEAVSATPGLPQGFDAIIAQQNAIRAQQKAARQRQQSKQSHNTGTSAGELNIDDLLNTPSADQAGAPDEFDAFIAQLVGVDASALPTFDKAQRLIQSAPEFAELKKETGAVSYSLEQLRTAYDNLLPRRSSMNSNDWRQKLDQISELLSKKELVEAATQECSLSYLTQFKDDRRWQNVCDNPLYIATISNDPSAPRGAFCGERPLQYRIEAPFLQRLCAIQLSTEIGGMLSRANSVEELEQVAESYLSRPVLAGGVGVMGREPRRIMTEEQWLPNGYAQLQASINAFEQRNADRQFTRTLLDAMDGSGLKQWVSSHPDLVTGGLRYYAAVARSAEFRLDAARAHSERLVLSRAGASQPQSLLAAYQPPQYSFGEPDYKQVNVLSSIACSGVPALLDALLMKPQTVGAKDYAELQFRRRACDADVNPFDSRRLEADYRDYAIAMSMSSSEGAGIAARLREDGDKRLTARQAFTRKTSGLYGYGYNDLYGAIELSKRLDALAAAMRNSYYQYPRPSGDVPELTAETISYYEKVTGLSYSDIDAARSQLQAEEQRNQQEQLRARQQGRTATAAAAAVPADAELVTDYFTYRCFDSRMQNVNCDCTGKLWAERTLSGRYSSESAVMQEDNINCIDRDAIKAMQFAQCDSTRGENCGCYAEYIAKNATSLDTRVFRKLSSSAMQACGS